MVGGVLVGLAVIGGATAAIVQAVERQAEAAATEALTAVAVDYLGAIADGRGDAATALVPVDGPAPLLTAAALAAAARLPAFGVEAVELDGDTATVVVDFRTGQRRVERQLDAVREGGSWRLTTTVAEPVLLDAAGLGALPRQLGAEVAGGEATPLYPGMYRVEAFDHGVANVEAATVVIDGDPSTAQFSNPARWSVPDGLVEQVRALALSHAVACQASGSCGLPSPALLGLGDQTTSSLAPDSAVDFDVPVRVLQDGTSGPTQLEVGVRAAVGAAGGIDWLCSAPIPRGSTPPTERDWEACA